MQRYQVQVSVFLIGSKESGETPTSTAEEVAAAIVANILPKLEVKSFSTGTQGFFISGKVTL